MIIILVRVQISPQEKKNYYSLVIMLVKIINDGLTYCTKMSNENLYYLILF